MVYSKTNSHDKKALSVGLVLLFLVGVYFIGRNISHRNSLQEKTQEDQPTTVSQIEEDSSHTIEANVLWKKIQNNDQVEIIDIRLETEFEQEHIAHSKSVSIGSLSSLTSKENVLLVIVPSLSDPQRTETARNILASKSLPFFFLRDGIESWKAINAPIVSIGDPLSFIDQSKVNYIDPEKLKNILKDDTWKITLLDVQTKEDYSKKHIVGSINIPLSELERRSDEIPFGNMIVVYGENADISYQGGVQLTNLGILTAQTLSGNNHLSAGSGLPLEP